MFGWTIRQSTTSILRFAKYQGVAEATKRATVHVGKVKV